MENQPEDATSSAPIGSSAPQNLLRNRQAVPDIDRRLASSLSPPGSGNNRRDGGIEIQIWLEDRANAEAGHRWHPCELLSTPSAQNPVHGRAPAASGQRGCAGLI